MFNAATIVPLQRELLLKTMCGHERWLQAVPSVKRGREENQTERSQSEQGVGQRTQESRFGQPKTLQEKKICEVRFCLACQKTGHHAMTCSIGSGMSPCNKLFNKSEQRMLRTLWRCRNVVALCRLSANFNFQSDSIRAWVLDPLQLNLVLINGTIPAEGCPLSF